MKAFLKFFKHRRGQQRAENIKNCNAKCSTLVLASKYQNSDERQTLRNLAKLHFFSDFISKRKPAGWLQQSLLTEQ